MIFIIGVVLYGLLALFLTRPLAGHFAWVMAMERGHKKPGRGRYMELSDWTHGWIRGSIAALLWPAAIVIAMGGRAITLGAEKDAKEKAELKRLRQMERELLDKD